MTATLYSSRNTLEIFTWPELSNAFFPLARLCLGAGRISSQTKLEAFTLLSLQSGCRHCQAHGGYGLHLDGVALGRIQALWTFEQSALFSDKDKAVFRFAIAAGTSPGAVEPDHYAQLRCHFADEDIRELLAVVAISGFLNRYSDAVAVVTDQESVDWAEVALAPVGWAIGKHHGNTTEQRPSYPRMPSA